MLVAAFRATLEEIAESDLLLHVVDITHANASAQARAVFQTLEEINADSIPVLTVLNKVDRLENPHGALETVEAFPGAVAISALTGDGIQNLVGRINYLLYEVMVPVSVWLPYKQGGMLSLFHEQGQVTQIEHQRGGVLINGKLPGRLLARFQSFNKTDDDENDEEV